VTAARPPKNVPVLRRAELMDVPVLRRAELMESLELSRLRESLELSRLSRLMFDSVKLWPSDSFSEPKIIVEFSLRMEEVFSML